MKGSTEKVSMLQHLEVLSAAVQDSNMSMEFNDKEKTSLKAVMDFLKINKIQAILFAAIFMLSFKESSIDISNIAEHMKSSTLKVAAFLNDLEALMSKKLIQNFHRGINPYRKIKDSIHDISYNLSRRVLEAILEENPDALKSIQKMDMVSMLEYIFDLIQDRDDDQLSYDELLVEVDELLIANEELVFVKRVKDLDLREHDRVLLLYVCREVVNLEDDIDLNKCIGKIYSEPRLRYYQRRGLVMGYNKLVKTDILKLCDGMFRNDRDIEMSEHGIELLFEEDLELLKKKDSNDKSLILHKDIKSIDLYFGPELQVQLSEMIKVLSDKNYNNTIECLKQQNMPEGIAVLLHGAPGTGKTAVAYQIARQTGRDIMQVDISNTKSFWFGESEKIIRKVFTDYREKVDRDGKAPILLFNECDAVFGKRKEVGHSTVDQTENAIQNIILQAMEELKGILIATTNLTTNLDKAFERRFLWKIKFEAPKQEARSKIWMSKLPFLGKKDASILAGTFNLSGGNIENIARKVVMHEIINGVLPDLPEIKAYCYDENSMSSEKQRIGF